MGYGINLKNAIEAKGMTVKAFARGVGISSTTLYSCIKRDTALRYDHALRVASALDIDVNEICRSNPYVDDTEELPGLLSDMGGILTEKNILSYIKNRTFPILRLLGYKEMPNIDRLLAEYYALDDEGRQSVFDFLTTISIRHTDDERKKELMDMESYR